MKRILTSYFEPASLAFWLGWMAMATAGWLALSALVWDKTDITTTGVVFLAGGLVGRLAAVIYTNAGKAPVSQRGIVTDGDLIGGIDHTGRHPDDLHVDTRNTQRGKDVPH